VSESSKLVQITSVPTSVEEFLAQRTKVATTPEGGAVMMVVALMVYANDEKTGLQCLTVATDQSRLMDGPKGYKGRQLANNNLQRIRLQISGKEYLPSSYVQGTSPQNGYRLPNPPYGFACSSNPYSGDASSGTYKVFVATSGAPTPRPVTVKVNDKGIWKASEWSSLIVGVQPPAATQTDDL